MVRAGALLAAGIAAALLLAVHTSTAKAIEPGGCRCHDRISVVYCAGYPHRHICRHRRHHG